MEIDRRLLILFSGASSHFYRFQLMFTSSTFPDLIVPRSSYPPAPVTDVVFSPDGEKLYTASPDATVRTYVMDIDQLLELAWERIPREQT